MVNRTIRFNKRQDEILVFLEKIDKSAAMSDILGHLSKNSELVTRMTVNRDLRELLGGGYIEKTGTGRGAVYFLSPSYHAIRPIDVNAYFDIGPDHRKVKNRFNFDVFSLFENVFTNYELLRLDELNKIYRRNLEKLSTTALKREYERLTIELSWKSSKIEGNTYSLLETEYLLKENREPKGHTKEETTMILNHKTGLDYVRAMRERFVKLDLRDIEDVHCLLTKELGVARNIRTGLVRVSGTVYQPLDNKFQIKEAIEETCKVINRQKSVFAKALIAMLMLAYIQPFEDGNKRTSRIVGNAILIAHDACPLSFRSIDELEYKKSILLFYEQNNFSYFKELFIKQFEFAVENYFG